MAGEVWQKSADEVENFGLDWSRRLSNQLYPNDTIVTSTWTLESGIIEDASDVRNNSTWTAIKISGGTDGERYTVTNDVVTAAGRELQWIKTLVIRDQSG